jgi:hypothetical protein
MGGSRQDGLLLAHCSISATALGIKNQKNPLASWVAPNAKRSCLVIKDPHNVVPSATNAPQDQIFHMSNESQVIDSHFTHPNPCYH